MHNKRLEIQDLSAGYNGATILEGVSLTLEPGEVLVIIGENGSGKSTLLKTLGGLLSPQKGSVRYDGRPLPLLAPHCLVREGLSLFLQGGLILPALTVKEHLQLAAGISGHKGPVAAVLTGPLERLNGLSQQAAGNLSSGERQLLSFGILLLQNTTTWLLDEPTAGLAPEMVRLTTDFLLRKNREEGVSMLLVEHNLEVAWELATHIVVARDKGLTRKFGPAEFQSPHFLDKIVYS